MENSEINSLLKELQLDLTRAEKELLSAYAEKRGLNADELKNDILKIGIDKMLLDRAPRFMASSVLSFEQFTIVVKRNGFLQSLTHAELREMYEIFMSLHKEGVRNMDVQTVGAIFKGAKKYMIVNTDRYVDFSSVKELIKAHQTETDLKLYDSFYKIDKKFKEINFLDQKLPVDKLIRSCYKKAQQVCSELNIEEDLLVDDIINIVWSLACIYNSLALYTSDSSKSDRRLTIFAEKLLEERILTKSTIFFKDLVNNYPDVDFEKTQMYYFDEFLKALMTDTSNEKFDEQDIYELINHTPYLVFAASKEKLEGARAAINMYIERVITEFPKMKRKTSKDIFKKAGSILDNSPIANENAVRLLLGETIGDIMKANFKKDKYLSVKNSLKQEYMKFAFADIKISGMDFNKHSFALNTRNSIFKQLSVDNMYDCISNVLTLTCEALNIDEKYMAQRNMELSKLGFRVNEMFTGDNIFDIFDVGSKFITQTNEKREDFENYKKNIRILSGLISVPNIFKIVQHNFKFLTTDNTNEFAKIIKASKTQEELLSNLTKLINSKVKSSTTKEGALPKDNESKFTKLNKETVELDALTIDPSVLKELGINLQFEIAKEKPKRIIKKALKDREIVDAVGILNNLEDDINSADEFTLVEEEKQTEDAAAEEKEEKAEEGSLYDDWAKLQFEMSSIAEYFSQVKVDKLSAKEWYKHGKKIDTHAGDSEWLVNFGGLKNTIIYDLLERTNDQYVSTLSLPTGKTSVRSLIKSLNETLTRVLAVKDQIDIDKNAVKETIECLDAIIEMKTEDKQALMEQTKRAHFLIVDKEEQPRYIELLLKRSKEILTETKKKKVSAGLIRAATKEVERLNSNKRAALKDDSPYSEHVEARKSANYALTEYERLTFLIRTLQEIRASFVQFNIELNMEKTQEVETAQENDKEVGITNIQAKIDEIEQKIERQEAKVKSLETGGKNARALIQKVEKQIANKRAELTRLYKQLESLQKETNPNR